jgi:hypothetical protein
MKRFPLIAFAITLASATTSRADTCSTMLGPLFAAGGAHVHMTISLANAGWVSYTDGFLPLTSGWITGKASQLFSDRLAYEAGSFIGQPFNIGAPDTHTPYLGSNGDIWIWNNTWSFWTHVAGTCQSGFVYGIVDNAMITISASPWTPPPPPR